MRVKTFRVLLFAIAVMAVSCIASISPAQVGVSVSFGPPALPVYEQPVCPGDGYIWTPGYWAWDGEDYYWVPGTWVLAPEVGFLWTPPWWGWENGGFFFHDGFWGPNVGFYGGIDYGFGYFGVGFVGGRWDGGHFFYNRSITNVDVVNIHNVYNETVVHENRVNRVSYNGGQGGITARPTAQEEAAARDHHIPPVAAQNRHVETAMGNRELRASENHGKPPIAATGRPGEFSGHDAVAARDAGGAYTPPPNRPAGGAAHPIHPSDLHPERPAAPNTGDAKLDQKYQKQQDKLYAKQQKDQQKLQKQQDKEHVQFDNNKGTAPQRQQMEQRHQQQTEHLQQQHTQEQQHLQTRQQPQRK